ncbi:MAG TPA: threonine--tRNA ligase [Polyangiales bacterium]|nr:threonine--tRNA ligase [Polyangiales bacterium]
MNDSKSDPESAALSALRRVFAHVLAQAVLELRPGTLLGAVQATPDGFCSDFVLHEALHPEELPGVEARMREIARAGFPDRIESLPAADALRLLDERGQKYQRELAALSLESGQKPRAAASIAIIRHGDVVQFCEAPEAFDVPRLDLERALEGFELRSLAGAYFRGDAQNVMMSRVSAWAMPSRAELDAKRADYEAAGLREHKKLGRELELFAFDDEIGPGLPLWLPNGTAIRDELERLMRELEFDAGFERVATPHIARQELYYRTGHLPYYADSMFPFMKHPDDPDGAVFALRPMNCPHHHKVFAAKRRSHRELPFRISEYGHVYRYEDSGAVSGLLRTRCMCMNDAHIYCTPEQVVPELLAVLEMHRHVYQVLGLSEFRIRLSTRGDGSAHANKFVKDADGWARSEAILRQVLEQSRMPYFEGPGEAAFYGPKIDFQFRMVTGREETASTLQLDFAMAERLDLSYVGPDGSACRPLILHRAPLGTHERFVALLIERFGGAFPSWLAPIQARVLPVGEAYDDYAREVQRVLRSRRVRCDVDLSGPTLGKRIREAALRKVPNVLVVGEREIASRTVTWRRRGSSLQESVSLAELEQRLGEAITARALDQ